MDARVSGSVGALLNNGNGTFAAMQTYTAGPQCAGLAVDVTLGDVTRPAPENRLQPDGKLDAYVACTPKRAVRRARRRHK
jgi:hypothetical protein